MPSWFLKFIITIFYGAVNKNAAHLNYCEQAQSKHAFGVDINIIPHVSMIEKAYSVAVEELDEGKWYALVFVQSLHDMAIVSRIFSSKFGDFF